MSPDYAKDFFSEGFVPMSVRQIEEAARRREQAHREKGNSYSHSTKRT